MAVEWTKVFWEMATSANRSDSPLILRKNVLGDFCLVMHVKPVREHSTVGVGVGATSDNYAQISILPSSF